MKALTLKALAILICTLFFSSCDNSTGPTILNNNGNGTGNNAPNKPNSPSPADSSINVNNNITLTWHCTDPDAGDTLKYDVYLSDTNPPTIYAAGESTPVYGVGLVEHDKVFFWKIVAKDNHGSSATGPVWRFRTAP